MAFDKKNVLNTNAKIMNIKRNVDFINLKATFVGKNHRRKIAAEKFDAVFLGETMTFFNFF